MLEYGNMTINKKTETYIYCPFYSFYGVDKL